MVKRNKAQELAKKLHTRVRYKGPLVAMPLSGIRAHLQQRIATAPLERILPSAAAGPDVPKIIRAD